MGHRLSKIYTRTGDDGTTGLGDGSRVPKTHGRIEAYGTVDEANSAIGVILAVPNLPPAVSEALTKIQHELFDLGGELAVPGYRAIHDSHIDELEQCLDRFNEPLPPLKEFILPGGGPSRRCMPHGASDHAARGAMRVGAGAERSRRARSDALSESIVGSAVRRRARAGPARERTGSALEEEVGCRVGLQPDNPCMRRGGRPAPNNSGEQRAGPADRCGS